ncbi:hypothetical protein MW332_001138 [Vibrio parahaemolyticus]|nr:hypothetical protein [Vibrio parahaemolyticus]
MEYNENYELKGLFGVSIAFDSTVQLQSYINDQLSYFHDLRTEGYKNKGTTIQNIFNSLNNLKVQIDIIVKAIELGKPVTPQHLANLQSHLNHLSKHWVPKGHPILQKLKQIFDEYGVSGEQTFWVNATGNFKQATDHNSMMGMLGAFDYLYERRTIGEVSSADREFVEQNYSLAIEKANELEEERKSLNNRISLWEKGRQDSWEKWEESCKGSWEALTEEKNSEWESDQATFANEHREMLDASTKKLRELEATYQEHLKLEKPAEYWSKSAKKYDDSSSLWFGLLAVLILAGVGGFAHFYSVYLSGQNTGVTLDTVKGIVLFVSGITVYGFLVRVVSRMLMSATHLKRDSEERAQLTYFYLALIKDGAIDEKSRDIVIQSLFSRTETGLITGDSSPTMPAMDVLKNIKIGN